MESASKRVKTGESMDTSFLDTLTDETLMEILCYVDIPNLKRLSSTSKRIWNILNDSFFYNNCIVPRLDTFIQNGLGHDHGTFTESNDNLFLSIWGTTNDEISYQVTMDADSERSFQWTAKYFVDEEQYDGELNAEDFQEAHWHDTLVVDTYVAILRKNSNTQLSERELEVVKSAIKVAMHLFVKTFADTVQDYKDVLWRIVYYKDVMNQGASPVFSMEGLEVARIVETDPAVASRQLLAVDFSHQ